MAAATLTSQHTHTTQSRRGREGVCRVCQPVGRSPPHHGTTRHHTAPHSTTGSPPAPQAGRPSERVASRPRLRPNMSDGRFSQLRGTHRQTLSSLHTRSHTTLSSKSTSFVVRNLAHNSKAGTLLSAKPTLCPWRRFRRVALRRGALAGSRRPGPATGRRRRRRRRAPGDVRPTLAPPPADGRGSSTSTRPRRWAGFDCGLGLDVTWDRWREK